jgi:hypothetical protein
MQRAVVNMQREKWEENQDSGTDITLTDPYAE